MTWAPSGKSATSSATTRTGETLPRSFPVASAAPVMGNFSVPGRGWEREPKGTAASWTLIRYSLAQVP